ncbi:TetR family transcriptional regulator [Actinobaculum sp. 352]|uniref:TetR family transcriptional regulator n=1 Tax=Actinobaculum sp. 352 TaxID=2490946 RepID=UPI000F7F753A|nr:TetR family transcriptional regulator [Actinobaculum sp. 352]RTE48499.1 TetR family transcriptional regulator [Actinobaculum sp. 352]
MKRTAAEAALTRQAIICAALHRFAHDGWENCSLGDVARDAEVTRGAIYHHFAGKFDLLLAVLADRWEFYTRELFAPRDAAGLAKAHAERNGDGEPEAGTCAQQTVDGGSAGDASAPEADGAQRHAIVQSNGADHLTDFLATYLEHLVTDTGFRELAVVSTLVAPRALQANRGMDEKRSGIALWGEYIDAALRDCGDALRLPLEASRFTIMSFIHGVTVTAALQPNDLAEPLDTRGIAEAIVHGLISAD